MRTSKLRPLQPEPLPPDQRAVRLMRADPGPAQPDLRDVQLLRMDRGRAFSRSPNQQVGGGIEGGVTWCWGLVGRDRDSGLWIGGFSG